MPVLWTAGVGTGRLTKEEFVAVTSANIARILNIYPRKGAVAVGSDADLVIWDPAATKTIRAKKQVSRIDYNVFEATNARVFRGSPFRAARSPGRMATSARKRATGISWLVRPSPGACRQCDMKEISAPRPVDRKMDVVP